MTFYSSMDDSLSEQSHYVINVNYKLKVWCDIIIVFKLLFMVNNNLWAKNTNI
jgi:hypothetical protein